MSKSPLTLLISLLAVLLEGRKELHVDAVLPLLLEELLEPLQVDLSEAERVDPQELPGRLEGARGGNCSMATQGKYDLQMARVDYVMTQSIRILEP